MLLVPAKKQVPTACSNPVLIHIFNFVLPYSNFSTRFTRFAWGDPASVHLFYIFATEGICLWVPYIVRSSVECPSNGAGSADMVR